MKQPSLIDKLVVVDISPLKVSPGAQSMAHYLTAMKEADLSSSVSFSALRKDVDKQLEPVVKVYFITDSMEHNNYSIIVFYRKSQ